MTLPLKQSVFRLRAVLGFALLAASLSGCATTRTVIVDAKSNPTANSGFAYAIDPNSPAIARGDAAGREVVERVRLALSQRGMFEAETPAQADVVVSVEYGERKAHTKVTTVSEPVVVQNDPLATIGAPAGGIVSPASYPGGRYPASQGGQSQVVYQETTRITRVSEKYVRINARENPSPRESRRAPPVDVWAVEAAIEDESADVPKTIPVLIDAATEYIGVTTAGPQEVKVEVPSGS